MQRNPIPEYKPPPEIQQLLDNQAKPGQRRRTAVLPKRNWIQRNPRTFQISLIIGSLLVFFSKPLYDTFIAIPLPPPVGGPIPGHKR